MIKEIYFECECGGNAVLRIQDLVDEENKFDLGVVAHSKFVCKECGKTYYSGEVEEFVVSEEDLD